MFLIFTAILTQSLRSQWPDVTKRELMVLQLVYIVQDGQVCDSETEETDRALEDAANNYNWKVKERKSEAAYTVYNSSA